jgi:hypothetical protein
VDAASFGARLDLFYFYLLEYFDDESGKNGGGGQNITEYLPRFDHAVATALVKHLSDCDGSDDDRPLYGVLLSNHELSLGGALRLSESDTH